MRRKQTAICLSLNAALKTVAYRRVSARSQHLANQKLAILDHAHQKHFAVDRFVEVQVSFRKGRHQGCIDELLDSLTVGDPLVVSELSCRGRICCRLPGHAVVAMNLGKVAIPNGRMYRGII